MPGTYKAELKAGDETSSIEFEIVPDPRRSETQEDYQAQFDLHKQINDKLSETNEAINTIRRVRKQAASWAERVSDEEIKGAATSLDEKLLDIEGQLIQYRAKSLQDILNFGVMLDIQLSALAGYVAGAEGRPPQQSYDVFQELSDEVDTQLARLNDALETDVRAFNDKIAAANVGAVSVEQ